MLSYQYMNSHYKNKTVSWPSYFYVIITYMYKSFMYSQCDEAFLNNPTHTLNGRICNVPLWRDPYGGMLQNLLGTLEILHGAALDPQQKVSTQRALIPLSQGVNFKLHHTNTTGFNGLTAKEELYRGYTHVMVQSGAVKRVSCRFHGYIVRHHLDPRHYLDMAIVTVTCNAYGERMAWITPRYIQLQYSFI